MGISGRIAAAARIGLENQRKQQTLEDDIEAKLRQEAIENARAERELGMRDREFSLRESEAAERRADREATRAEREAERTRKSEAEAGTKRMLGNMAGVVEMMGSGMDPDTARREIAMTGLRGGVEPPRMLEGLMPVAKEPKRHPVTTTGPDGRPLRRLVDEEELIKGVPEYREPKVPRPSPSRGLTQRDIASAMRQARRDAIAAYKTQAGPTGRVTDESGTVVDLGDFVDAYVDDYMGDLDRLLSSEDAEGETSERAPSVRLRPRSGPSTPTAPASGAGTPPPPGARPIVGGLRRIQPSTPTPQQPPPRPNVGDVVTLRDGSRVRVTGFDAAGKVQGARVP